MYRSLIHFLSLYIDVYIDLYVYRYIYISIYTSKYLCIFIYSSGAYMTKNNHTLNVFAVLHGSSSLSSPLLHPFCCFYPVLSPHVPPQPPLLLHLPLSVALLFIAMSSQGSAATKAFSCCHYNYSLHTSHTHTHTCVRAHPTKVSLCLHVCARLHGLLYIKKGRAIFTSRPPLHQANLPPTHSFIPLCRQPHLLC